MINRRNSFASTLEKPALDFNLFTPWKRPANWLHSFKPGNLDKLKPKFDFRLYPKDGGPYEILKSKIDMKANKLEYKPGYSTSTKEAFIPRTEFTKAMRYGF